MSLPKKEESTPTFIKVMLYVMPIVIMGMFFHVGLSMTSDQYSYSNTEIQNNLDEIKSNIDSDSLSLEDCKYLSLVSREGDLFKSQQELANEMFVNCPLGDYGELIDPQNTSSQSGNARTEDKNNERQILCKGSIQEQRQRLGW